MKRTMYCGLVREAQMGTRQTCCGWVQTKRDMGGVVFVDLKDREGILQVVFDASALDESAFKTADGLRSQSVIAVSGVIRRRSEDTYNPRLATGTVELYADSLELLSQAQQLPFSMDDNISVREDLRLRYRYLDLRSPAMLKNLRARHLVQKASQDYLDAQGFICVETPMLCKSTPEGARDYLVPSRVHQGSFYALPQSPQIYKQLLMVGGIDKYYQVARCFRDEDLRADRQPEFTQVDMEMSFVDQEDILVHLEKMFGHIFKAYTGRDITEPFPRLTWHEAMDRYGSDKPDLRFDLPIIDVTDLAAECSFSVFRSVCDKGGVVRAINAKGCANFTRTQIETLTENALSYGAKGMAWIAIRPDGEIYSILTKYFTKEEMQALLDRMGAVPGDFVLFSADSLATVRRTLGNLRLDIAEILGLRDKEKFSFLFVTDFPQFEYSEEEKRYVSTHHPFTMPYPEDIEYLFTDPGRVRAQAYDVVLNGIELGSGSIRIHRQDVQEKMFEALGFSAEEIETRFGFMVNAFRYGTPPHGGFAFGLDRLVMLLLGADSLRDVIAFPKIKDASCPMTDAPTPVDPEQLAVLGLDKLLEGGDGGAAEKKEKTPQIDVPAVAGLARLAFSKEEMQGLQADMKNIIAFADQLSKVDTTGTAAAEHIVPMENVFRTDAVDHPFDREELLAAAKTKDDGYITVPRVVEG
ncbi:MAG: aspartate--tRNA ligase [Clostridiales bacterium]|nr:aspartate--tRNA ligase [Clostridiales bacterium]